MRESGVWTYAFLNLFHILGVSTLFGSILVLDLRLLGLARQLAIRDLSVLQEMHLTDHVAGWRRRIIVLLIGESPSLADQVRGMVAIGGLSDCAVAFEDVDVDELRTAAVDAAHDTLGSA